jgi:preprotein translocase subunit SecG
MEILLTTIHIMVCVALIVIVLLQTGKGASIGASFGGGGSQTLFGGSGAATFLSKATTIIAIIFMLTSLSLAYMSGHTSKKSVLSELASPPSATTSSAQQDMPTDGQKEATEALPVEEGAK